jgi:oligopeptide transport system ATP-binding protein
LSGGHLLEVRDLVTCFPTDEGVVRAVNGVSFTLDEGEALAIVGESGSGKSVSALSILGLAAPGRVEHGVALLRGRDLLSLSQEQLCGVRGRQIAMVFQDPEMSLNPVLNVGSQVAEGLREHLGMSRNSARKKAVELLSLVGIPNAASRLLDYPHEFSGGQRQRILIAMALACEPSVLIADEPTTALDVTIQAQIVELVRRLQERLGMAILWITHDLALVAGLVDRVAVMYAGSIVEQAPVGEIFRRPRHPYTQGLLRAMPRWADPTGERLAAIPGAPPDLREDFHSCPFAPRCAYVVERCRAEKPALLPAAPGHESACFRADEL